MIEDTMAPATTIKSRLTEFAAASQSLVQTIRAQARAQISLKNSIIAKATQEISFSATECAGLSLDQIKEKFAEAVETALIETERPSQTAALQNLLERARSKATNNSLEAEPEEEELEAEPLSIIPDHDALVLEREAEAAKQEELAKSGKQESFSLSITLNPKQVIAKELAFQGESFCLIGPAGSGKTTATRSVAAALLSDNRLSTSSFKIANSGGQRATAPSIAFVAYTRRAAANLAKAIWKDPVLEEQLRYNIMTVHALLEYEPEEYYDSTEERTRFRFSPVRTASNPLDITHLVIEESSMLDAIVLWEKLYDALPIGVQIIFIGDINQLPPVFGPSILNYALCQLPIVELTETYRNQGIVLDNAHHILKGEALEEDHNYRIVRGKEPVQQSQFKTMQSLKNLFKNSFEAIGDDGFPEYDPEDCMILSPFNKQELGTDNVNKHIAQFIGDARGAVVYEVLAGMNKQYLAVGDRVMFNKRDATIKAIQWNMNYHGKIPQIPGKDLSRHGFRIMGKGEIDSFDDDSSTANYDNFSLEALEEETAERKQQASHVVTIIYDDGMPEELKSAGDFASQVFSLGYCLTVHKAQGSEWRKVFIILHKEHAVSLYRELFYTAATRARTKVTIIAKDHTIAKAIKNQRIKGNTLQDKLEYFNSGVEQLTNINCKKL